MDSSQAADSLAAWLAGTSFADQDADAANDFFADAAAAWADAQGWRVYRKARSVMKLPPPYDDRHSWVDVACAQTDGPPIVIEVDRSDRKRAIEKLLAESQAGRIALWIRWGRGPFTQPPEPVRMVSCPVTGRHKLYSWRPVELAAPQHSDVDLSAGDQADLF